MANECYQRLTHERACINLTFHGVISTRIAIAIFLKDSAGQPHNALKGCRSPPHNQLEVVCCRRSPELLREGLIHIHFLTGLVLLPSPFEAIYCALAHTISNVQWSLSNFDGTLQLCVSVLKVSDREATYSRSTGRNRPSSLIFFDGEIEHWNTNTSRAGTQMGIGKELEYKWWMKCLLFGDGLQAFIHQVDGTTWQALIHEGSVTQQVITSFINTLNNIILISEMAVQ